MKLSDKAEEILEALWIESEEKGTGYAELDRMEIDPSDPAYHELSAHALVEIRGGRIYFRPEGREEGRMTIRRHRLAERLMMDVLNIRGESGDVKACQFEHLLNEGVDSKVCTMLNHPATCPHGKPIPPGECCEEARKTGDLGVVPLTELKPGDDGDIAYIQTEDSKKMQKLMAMGVLPGNRISLLQAFPSYIFRVGFSEFAIDSAMAREIFVRR
ncbi:metal-dependent transcriptional regulator [Geomonas sp. Red69]|uniref:Metal-dependent transcriptional regulator n=1 Tax=Geomonas diazotrophica TaxID=2843197 RepID=A0ABX8JC74_9BACT|nr:MULTISPECIES: metal-dependent transcriptional regulator [Geomonas]MBU5636104.1 metal-dependent transcriptional regulator [Geomonas diazotrophica]QWV96004.1 metal-dependent transcriptional regulator [Geomonas nitrogeniifigens]QXE85071.1 metal-dependent transcriptional regulator [Geomonas nitrogeniifigens]